MLFRHRQDNMWIFYEIEELLRGMFPKARRHIRKLVKTNDLRLIMGIMYYFAPWKGLPSGTTTDLS